MPSYFVSTCSPPTPFENASYFLGRKSNNNNDNNNNNNNNAIFLEQQRKYCDKSANYVKHLKCSKTGYKEKAGTSGKC